ncbi:hypothetical protein NEOLEDRAFT_1029385, partial [Neolentinus lepideus HHB14362 ss-1]
TYILSYSYTEVCSAHPTSGSPYFWAAMLSPPKDAPFASWTTGWFNLLGQHAPLSSYFHLNFGCATFISTACTLGTSFIPNETPMIGIYAAMLVMQGLINTFSMHLLKYLNNISVWWHAMDTSVVVIAILAATPTHQSAKFVLVTFLDGTGINSVGWSQRASPAYVAIIGILMDQYTLTDFNASAHVS